MKRLVVCCDGTWNKLSSPCPTNVVRIAQAVKSIASDGVPQLLYYEKGLGTEWYDKLPGGAFGWGIDANIKSAYLFLSLNYEPGDEIYLFGFSRGSYTVRSLAGMIHCSGLLSRHKICYADAAYELYRDDDIKPGHPKAIEFRSKNGERVPITLLGCWDTVGSLGIPDLLPLLPVNQLINGRYRFHDTRLSSSIQNALHAVSIDEQRKVFDVTPMQKSEHSTTQTLNQVWFPGDHGCVGGGTEAKRGLSDAALRWMMDQIQQIGLKLEFEEEKIQDVISPEPTIDFKNDAGIYKLAGTHWRPILGGFECLHPSVKKRWQSRPDYRPKNLTPFKKDLDI